MKDYIKSLIEYLPKYISELLAVISGPKRFIRGLNVDNNETLTTALIYAAISFILATILLPSELTQVGIFDADILLQMGKTMVVILLMAIALYGAWRLVGGMASIQSFVITYCYYSGTQFLLISIIASTAVKALKIKNEAVYSRLLELLVMPPSSEVHRELAQLGTDPACQQTKVIFAIGVVAIVVWFIGFWGAYRELENLSRLRSAAALVIALLFMSITGYIALLMLA